MHLGTVHIVVKLHLGAKLAHCLQPHFTLKICQLLAQVIQAEIHELQSVPSSSCLLNGSCGNRYIVCFGKSAHLLMPFHHLFSLAHAGTA